MYKKNRYNLYFCNPKLELQFLPSNKLEKIRNWNTIFVGNPKLEQQFLPGNKLRVNVKFSRENDRKYTF